MMVLRGGVRRHPQRYGKRPVRRVLIMVVASSDRTSGLVRVAVETVRLKVRVHYGVNFDGWSSTKKEICHSVTSIKKKSRKSLLKIR